MEEHGLSEEEHRLAQRGWLPDLIVGVLRSLSEKKMLSGMCRNTIKPKRGGSATAGAQLVVVSMTEGKRTGN